MWLLENWELNEKINLEQVCITISINLGEFQLISDYLREIKASSTSAATIAKRNSNRSVMVQAALLPLLGDSSATSDQTYKSDMLRFHVITLFPELIELYCSTSIIGRGMTNEKLAVRTYNPREHCTDRYRKVDDTPYGGGAGMVLKPEPLFKAFESIDRHPESPVIITSPQGKPFEQADAVALSQEKDITIFCGHYEGFDERVHTLATLEYSVGDYVLTGGELPALAIIDAVGRLVPGVLGKQISLAEESFNAHLLEGPQYTKPAEFRDMNVPEILLSGNHKAVAEWRHKESLRRTFERRPDLLEQANLSASDKQFLKKLSGEKP